MRTIWIMAYAELLRFARMRSVLISLFVVPLVIIFILGSALSSQFSTEDHEIVSAKLAVFNEDTGAMKAAVEQFLNNAETKKYVETFNVHSEAELKKLLDTKEADYGLAVPNDFSAKILSGQSANWTYYPGSISDKNRTAEMTLNLFVSQTNQHQAAAMVFGPERSSEILTHSEKESTSISNHVVTGKLQDSLHNASAFEYYSCSMLIMFLLFSGMSAAISILTEKETKTLMRLYSMPVRSSHIILGKVVGVGLLSMIQAAVIIGFTSVVYGVNWGKNLPQIVLVCLLTIVASVSLSSILVAWIKSSKSLESIYSIIITVMTFLSGGMMVFLDGSLDFVGHFTINQWASGSLLRFMMNVDLTAAWNQLTVLGCIAGVLLAGAMVLSRKAGALHE